MFPVTGTDFFHWSSPAYSMETQNETAGEGNLDVLMKGFLLQKGEFLLSSAWGCDVRAVGHFHKAEELRVKMHWRATHYLQDSEVLESSEIGLGDPGDVISVQVTAMENKCGSDFCRLHLWSI